MKIILAILLAVVVADAQRAAFEVASIKRASSGADSVVSQQGGPGTKQPLTWTCSDMTLRNIVAIAFHVPFYKLIFPDSVEPVRFDIIARVRPGATREEFYEMLQALLIDRFALSFHREEKDLSGYELTVTKKGQKFGEAVPAPPTDTDGRRDQPGSRSAVGFDSAGYPELPVGVSGVRIARNRASGQWLGVSMSSFARDLESRLGSPVSEASGLTGKYDLRLHWTPDPMRPEADGPDLLSALSSQLGLNLERKKIRVTVLVVDHAEKLPTEN